MARWLFQPSIQDSVTGLSSLPEWSVNRLCTHFQVACDLQCKDVPLNLLTPDDAYRVCLWARTTLPPGPMLSYYETIHNYDACTREKLRRFVDNHLHPERMRPLGVSPFPDDLSFATRTTERVQLKRRPLEVLADHFDVTEIHPTQLARFIRHEATDDWIEDTFGELFSPLVYHPLRHVMKDADAVRAHSTYCACVYICQLMTEHVDVSDACQAYQLGET